MLAQKYKIWHFKNGPNNSWRLILWLSRASKGRWKRISSPKANLEKTFAGTGIKMPHMRRSKSQSQYFLEKVCCVINKWQFCTAKLAQSANYSSGAFFRNIHLMKIMLVMRNYAKNYASTIYQDLLTLYLFDLENILSDFERSLRFLHFGVSGGGGGV